MVFEDGFLNGGHRFAVLGVRNMVREHAVRL